MNETNEIKDIAIYGYGKIGRAIKTLADKVKQEDVSFNSNIFTIDINGTAQYQSVQDIKDIPNQIIHIIAIDTGVRFTTEDPGYEPDTYKVRELIEEIILERGADNTNGDVIIIESTVEIGFYTKLKEILKDYLVKWDIIISPERYLEDTTTELGFTMDQSKLCGIDIETGEESEFLAIGEKISPYLDIFNKNDIKILMSSIKEVEAAKVVENAFRLLNISFVNELQWFLSKKVDVRTVLNLVASKTGNDYIADLRPGLIGGGCIPIDPIYLPHLEKSMLKKSFDFEAGKMQSLITNTLALIETGKLKRICVMGAAYKPNSKSTKNSQYLVLIKNISAKLKKLYENNPEEAPSIYILDHLADDIESPEKYFEDNNINAMELIIVGANHKFKDTDYLTIALRSGANVFNLNTLEIHGRKEN